MNAPKMNAPTLPAPAAVLAGLLLAVGCGSDGQKAGHARPFPTNPESVVAHGVTFSLSQDNLGESPSVTVSGTFPPDSPFAQINGEGFIAVYKQDCDERDNRLHASKHISFDPDLGTISGKAQLDRLTPFTEETLRFGILRNELVPSRPGSLHITPREKIKRLVLCLNQPMNYRFAPTPRVVSASTKNVSGTVQVRVRGLVSCSWYNRIAKFIRMGGEECDAPPTTVRLFSDPDCTIPVSDSVKPTRDSQVITTYSNLSTNVFFARQGTDAIQSPCSESFAETTVH